MRPSNMPICNTRIQKAAGGVKLVGDVDRGTSSRQVPVQDSRGPGTHQLTLSQPCALQHRASHLSLETRGAQ